MTTIHLRNRTIKERDSPLTAPSAIRASPPGKAPCSIIQPSSWREPTRTLIVPPATVTVHIPGSHQNACRAIFRITTIPGTRITEVQDFPPPVKIVIPLHTVHGGRQSLFINSPSDPGSTPGLTVPTAISQRTTVSSHALIVMPTANRRWTMSTKMNPVMCTTARTVMPVTPGEVQIKPCFENI